MEKDNVLVWITNQMRVKDNPLIAKAQSISSNLIAIHVLDDYFENTFQFGIPKMNERRKSYLYHNIVSFEIELKKFNINLYAFKGETSTIIKNFCNQNKITHLVYPKEFAPEEIDIQEKTLQKITPTIHKIKIEDNLLISSNQTKNNLPLNFTKFKFWAEKNILYPTEYKITKLNNKLFKKDKINIFWKNESYHSFIFPVGENYALKRLEDFWWKTKKVTNYKNTRNELLGDFSSRLSTYLSYGNISVNEIYRVNKQFEDKFLANESTYWILFELLWRDFFKHTLLQQKNKMFYKYGFNEEKHSELNIDLSSFELWASGKTNCKIVDASMKELNNTGWLSNRSRQIVASYLINNLKIDYRLGSAYFESNLLDYDVANNQGNWLYLSGYGNDPRGRRYFNPEVQQQNYDPQKNYINYWLNHNVNSN